MREEVITPQTEYEKAIKLLEELIQRDLEEQKEDIQKLWELLKELEFIQDKDKLLPHTKYVKEVALFLLRRTAKTEYEDVFWRAMLLETPFKFESYIYYLEKNRPLDKQFYRPRQMTLKTVVDDLQDMFDDKLDVYGLSMPPRVGKLLADDTPVMTSKGWKNHGDLEVGDYVYGIKGEWVKVTKVFPKHYADKRIYLSNGDKIDCHSNHEWLVYDEKLQKGRVVSTVEIMQDKKRYFIPYTVSNNLYQEEGDEHWREITDKAHLVAMMSTTYFDKIESIPKKQGNCISVEGGLYRAGKSYTLTHNSTTGLLFLSWNALVNPNSHSALGGHSGRLTKGFYKELLNLFTEKEYTFSEMYSYLHPNHTLIQEKSAEDMTITMDEPDRFATLTCRGIDATWTGDIDVSKDGYLYVDDLIRDRQHSLSPSRMENTYQEYQNKMLDRVNAGGSVILIGTLWNVADPLERERKLHEGNPRARFRKIPALDRETGESNFDYKIKGFPTKYYLDMKARLDKAEWEAKYQQSPFVREGLLFEADQMEYFDGVLPEGEYTPVAVVDVAFGGGDRLSMPIGMLNKETRVCYIVDWLFNKGDKNVTKPLIINKIRTHEIPEIQFEKNSGGELYKDEIQEDLRNEKITCLLKSKSAPNNMSKEQKIQYYAPNIMKFVFLTPNRPTAEQKALDTANGTKRYARNNDYDLAMDETLMFVTEGKNLHDDAPDSLSQLAMYLDTKANKKATIISSPF